MKTHNPNTRALVSALRSDLVPLRVAAIKLIDEALEGSANHVLDLQVRFRASSPTAYALLRERERYFKSGRMR